jgi:hypothetical protein
LDRIIKQRPQDKERILAWEKEHDDFTNSEMNKYAHQDGILAPGVVDTKRVIVRSQWTQGTKKDRGGISITESVTLYVLGKITYYDIFPGTKPHTTKFCLMHTRNSNSFVICPANNWMD